MRKRKDTETPMRLQPSQPVLGDAGGMGLSTNRLDAFLEDLRNSDQIGDVWSASISVLAELGFDHISYLMVRLSAPNDCPLVYTTMPKWWTEVYLSADQLCNDPLFRFCGNLKPRLTGSDYLDLYPALSPIERDRVLAAGDIGCRTGFASPINMIGGGRCGGWNFGSSMSRAAFDNAYPKIREQVQLIGLYAHTRLETFLLQRENDTKPGSILSPREQECLSFLARGGRTSSIADLLGISPATVEFHLKNIKRKLGASTREEALVKAIAREQIVVPL
ncbi:MAG: LuxR C-terminal-related transcriptional regulator [Pseudomonadota bacterium]